MKYETQKIAYSYFVVATLLFGLQVIFGLITGAKYVWDYDPLINVFPFNTARAIHLNLLLFWLITGFMGGTYYVVSEEAQTEIYSVKLANFQLILFTLIGIVAVVGFILGWSWGMPFLEQPTVLKIGIVIVALIFFFNIFMTMVKTKKWTVIQGMLIGGLVTLGGLFLAGVFFIKNISTQYYFWAWVVHLWAEASWALISAAIMAFILIKITGVERTNVEKWLYIEIGLVLFTGIVATGHHYYWIGVPGYWLWFGPIFSSLSPVPILLMVMDTLRVVKERKIEIENKPALYWIIGSAVMHFFGAGVWGFAHSWPQINKWTHGTQFTASHAHFAFFGAYVMLDIAIIYFVLPQIKGFKVISRKICFNAFWIMNFFFILMVLSFTIAGVVQAYFQRIMGMDYLSTQGFMKLWFTVLWISAWGFMVGVLLYIIDFFSLRESKNA